MFIKIRLRVTELKYGLLLSSLSALLSCTTQNLPALEALQQDLLQIKADAVLASKASVALYDAEKAVKLANEAWLARTDQAEVEHLIYLAQRKIDITRYIARRKLIDDELTQLKSDREHLLMEGKPNAGDSAEGALSQ